MKLTQLGGDPIPLAANVRGTEALAYHRSIPNDYGGYFPAPDPDEDDEPAAVLEVEVEVNFEVELAATAPPTMAAR